MLMIRPTRRAVLYGALGTFASGAAVRPYIASAAATTATMWWAQGFAQEEDISLKKIVADYEKASGNRIDLSIIPFAPERQKIIGDDEWCGTGPIRCQSSRNRR